MIGVRQKIEGAGGDLEAIAGAIESGAAIAGEPSSVIAALALAGLGEDLGPPLVQAPLGRPGLKRAAHETALAALLPKAPRPAILSLSAGLLQILDDWDASHEAAQAADDLGEPEFVAYWHGIAHRREPDPGNAAYWFRRVGNHAAFVPLAQAAAPILEAHGNASLTRKILPDGRWDPVAFVRFCGEVGRVGSAEEVVARKIQRQELLILLDLTCGPL